MPEPRSGNVRRTWTVHVCPECGMQVELPLRRPQDVQCYGVAGSHAGTSVETVQVVALAELERLEREGSPGVMHAVDQAFYDLAVKERDYERVRVDRLAAELDEARADLERVISG